MKDKELAKKLDDLYFKLAKEDKELLEKILDAFEECAKQRQDLEQENKQLKEDKRKAIEYINYYAIEDDDFNKLYDIEEQELLAILGEKE